MIKTVTLKNGVRVVMQRMEGVRSVSVGVWINAGSVREKDGEAGVSHFIEHMVFKGTKRRTAEKIACEMDAVGGNLNAFTSKECTCFYAKVLDKHLSLAVDMLSDITLHSLFQPEELEKEKSVVIEEILMTEDSPEDLVSEVGTSLFFENDPLAKPILGTQESVKSFSRDTLCAYMGRHYIPKNIVIACAGSFDEDALLALCERYFDLDASDASDEPLEQRFHGGRRSRVVKKDIEQVHMTLMLPGCARDDQMQYPIAVLSNAFGGSMSSRLFQSIREKRGLAYSVYSYPIFYTGTGSFALYAGTGEKQAAEVLSLMLSEMEKLRTDGLTNDEFIRYQEQLKDSYQLSMESTGAVMNAIGKVCLLQNREYNEAETLERISCVTMEDIEKAIALTMNEKDLSAAFVGRAKAHEKSFLKLLDRKA